MIHQVVGYKFHQGVIACGRRKAAPSLDEVALAWPADATLVICPELNNTENLGLLIRIAAGFGASAMILGPRSCDPFFRQSVRVSMGAVFSLPIVRCEDLDRDLSRLRSAWDVELIATVLDASADPLSEAARKGRIALLFGNEAQGLDPRIVELCDRGVTIEMKLGTDSLNVAVAAGIFLYHFTR
jgi:tRNA G18 (ribose-2'-O)-methylase SpoU